MKKLIYWLPRILSIFFIIFISMFAFDVFETSRWFPALLIHLIPSFVLIALTIVAWKHARVGGFLFLLLGLLSIFYVQAIIAIPSIIIGIIFLIEKYSLKKY